jgi:DNA-binding transcriptional MocR family regulator
MKQKVYRNTPDGGGDKRGGPSRARVPLDRASRQPLYRQIADHLRGEIEAGRLAAGSRLPSIRELARDLGVNLVTAVAAYRELVRMGLAGGQVGRGTFVRTREERPPPKPVSPPGVPGDAATRWDRAALPQSRATMFFRPLGKDVVALNSGLPSGEFFPMAAFRRALDAVLRREGSGALQYPPMEGHGPLREAIASYLEGRGTPIRPEDVLLCSGAVTAIHIVGRLLAMPGDAVLTENPIHCGCLSGLESLG